MDDKKERILMAAEKLFARFGIRKTTMGEIAKEARMGKSTIYYYFNSKEDVFAEVIRRDSQIFRQKLDQAIQKANTPQDKIGSYVLTRMEHLKELTNFYTTLTDEYLEHYVFVEQTRKEFNEYEIATLKNLLNGGISKCVFRIEDVDISARMIAIVLKGLEYLLFVQDKERNLKYESKQMLNILFKGIENR